MTEKQELINKLLPYHMKQSWYKDLPNCEEKERKILNSLTTVQLKNWVKLLPPTES